MTREGLPDITPTLEIWALHASPRVFERKESSQFFFTDPYDFTVRKPSDIIYTNTKSPFTNLTYFKQGDGRYGEERFKAYFAVNVNKRMGFGFDIDYTYGRGKYDSQSTALFNGNLLPIITETNMTCISVSSTTT